MNYWSIFMSTLRVSTPLLFAAMGGLLSERSGVIQIALEGFMLVGAFAAAAIALFSSSASIGFMAGGMAGIALALLMGIFVLKFRADQIVVGTAINILAAGAIPLLSKSLFGSTGATPGLELQQRFQDNIPMFFAFALVALVFLWFSQTRSGLWTQFAGENPQALQVSGIRVIRLRWVCLAGCGLFAGWGGASLSLYLSSSYSPQMTSGRGFIALAALIFGRWKPLTTAAACLFFGLMEALQIQLQGGDTGIPVAFVQILPYLATIIALAGFFGHSRAPQALGRQPPEVS